MTSRTAAAVVFWSLACTLCALVLAQPAFASQDGPLHLYYARVLADLASGAGAWNGYYVLRPGFPPYMLHNIILIGAQTIAAPLMAEKILVAICILLLCAGFRHAALALRPSAAWSTLFIFPVVLHKSLYMGFYNFSLGLGIMLLVCGVWLRPERFGIRRAALFVAGMLLLAVTHPAPLILALCFAGLDLALSARADWREAGSPRTAAWLREWMARRRVRLGALALASATLVYIALYSTRVRPPEPPDLRMIANHLASTLEAIWPMRTPLQQAIRLAVTAALIALAAFPAKRPAGRPATVLGFSIACGVAYLLAPNNLNGADYFHERFAITGFLFLILYCAALDLHPRRAVAMGISAAILTLVLTADQLAQLRPYALEAARLDRLRPQRANELGLVVSPQGAIGPPGFNFSPCIHISAHYFRRAHAIFVNSSWLYLSFAALKPRVHEPYHYLDPQFMTGYVLRHPRRMPRVDFVVAEQCPPGPADGDLSRIVDRYSAGAAAALRDAELAIYDVRREPGAQPTRGDTSAGTGRP